MGLPLFVTPPETDVVSKIAQKHEDQRSAIRRSRPGRRIRLNPVAPSDLDRHAQMRQALRRRAGEELNVRREGDEPMEEDGEDPTTMGDRYFHDTRRRVLIEEANRAEADAMTWARLSPPSPPAEDTPRDWPRPVIASSDYRAAPPDGPEVPMMPPVPETGDFSIGHRSNRASRRANIAQLYASRVTLRRLARQHPATQPTDTLLGENASNPSTNAPSPGPTLTPDFSPARRYIVNESSIRSERPPTSTESPWASDSPRLTMTDDLPPLRRLGRRSIAEFESRRRRPRGPRLDGLGDRDRSLSPAGDGAWEVLRTTLTPDPQPPSVGSSFASNSASASASMNHRSSGTSLTTMDSMDEPSLENACEIIEQRSDGSQTDEEQEEEDDIYELQGNVHEARDRFWRSYADVVAARADRVARHSGLPDADSLGGMQRIVRRLARREDIPDEWWSEAGLSRNFSVN